MKLASALLSRFDLVFILLDRADEDQDRRISEHIMGIKDASSVYSNEKNSSDSGYDDSVTTLKQRLKRECFNYSERSDNLDHASLRKYIEFARENIYPKLSPAAAKVLQRMYLKMRSQGPGGDGCDPSSVGAMPVTTRHLESLIRLAQARARMELREIVRTDIVT